jgi:perosamine synthetase
MINFFEPVIHPAEHKFLNKIVKEGFISSQTPVVKKFEEKFSKWHNIKYAVSTANCTVALHLALLGLGIEPGDEVICPNLTFIAPANMIKLTGADLILVDVDHETFSMNVDEIKRKISQKTKAIMVVHAFGYPANMLEIKKLAKIKNLKIIEDVAEAIGARSNGRLCGTIGDVSCFSFFANKLITTGEGGMILTNNKQIYEKIKLLRDHGMYEKKKYYHKCLAFNYRMTSMQAALGISQLNRLKLIIKRKEIINKIYNTLLLKKNYKIFPLKKNKDSITWFVTIIFNKINLRNKFIKYMKRNQIECRPMIFPVSFATHFKKLFKKKDFAVSYRVSFNSVHLPSSLNLTSKQLNKICNKVNQWDAKI